MDPEEAPLTSAPAVADDDDPGQGPALRSLVNMSAALDLDSPAASAKMSVTVLRRCCGGAAAGGWR